MRIKRIHGFGTGEMVHAGAPVGIKAGTHTGRAAVRASGPFHIQSHQDGKAIVVPGICYQPPA